MDTFNWRNHLFYRSCFRTVTQCLRAPVSFCAAFLPCSLCPQSRKGTRPDSAVLWGSAQLLFIKQLRPLFEGYHTHLYPDTSHTLQQTGYRSPWEGWEEVRRSLINVKPYIFTLSSCLHRSHTHIYTHTESAPVNLYVCYSQVNKVTCLCTFPEKLFLRTSQVYNCLVTHFHHLHQSCTHTGMYL